MIIKETPTYQLTAALQPYQGQHSLTLHQRWPQAQNPHKRQILQVLLDDAELDKLACLLIRRKP